MFLGLSGTFIFAIKWVTFYAIALMFLLKVVYKLVEEHAKHNNELTNIKIPILYPITIFILICGLSIHMVETYDSFAFLDNKSGDYMVNAEGNFNELKTFADYLDENDQDASVFALFEQANYFEFRGYKVYSDARPELYTKNIAGSNEISSNSLIIYRSMDFFSYTEDSEKDNKTNYENYAVDAETYKKTLDNINTDYFVTQKTSINFWHCLDTSDNYEKIMETETCVMYKRID
jgi:hypothetical protein